ncbi:Resolvase YneB [Candidatus Hydrogenisulfobacillus filiaventi]|uniref:Resolvase YneB n=1 Tax=Candidatus Hydrogenisulfobacillus filiaventi TaxID=2707344 RepID=A0A6F8ZGM6_9FIRM|nr:Resolvase YneB [Candidatus Hydrogenisulfobacillus filiaventi]
MKLSDWARANGVSYKTAWLGWKQGKLPVPAHQTPTGTILVEAPEREEAGAVLYARVSSGDQRADLDRQVARLAAFAAERGLRVAKVIAEVGSGLNGHRKALMAVLRSPAYGVIIGDHQERLARFGSEYIEAALATSGRRLLVMEPDEVRDDLVQDRIDVLTSFCARLYGRRSARRRSQRALACATEEDPA